MPVALRWLAVSVIAVSPLLADEILPSDGFADLRLAYCFTQKQADVTVAGVTTTDDWRRSNRASGGVVLSPGLGTFGGWLFGVRAVATFSSGDPAGQSTTYDTLTAQFSIGYGYAFCRGFQLEVMPYIGLGAASLKQDFAAAGEVTDTAFATQYGVDVNAVATIAHGVQVGVSVGYEIAASDHEVDVPSLGSVTSKIKQKSLTGALFIGGRF